MADTSKDLRRMNRSELIEVIALYQKTNRELGLENKQLKEELATRDVKTREAGSLAQEALAVSGVFEAAQAAADQYLADIKLASTDVEARTKQLLDEAREEADALREQAKRECAELRAETETECLNMRKRVKKLIREREALLSFLGEDIAPQA